MKINNKMKEEEKRILNILEKDYGWNLTDSLSETGRKLVNDTLKAQESLKSNLYIVISFLRENKKTGFREFIELFCDYQLMGYWLFDGKEYGLIGLYRKYRLVKKQAANCL